MIEKTSNKRDMAVSFRIEEEAIITIIGNSFREMMNIIIIIKEELNHIKETSQGTISLSNREEDIIIEGEVTIKEEEALDKIEMTDLIIDLFRTDLINIEVVMRTEVVMRIEGVTINNVKINMRIIVEIKEITSRIVNSNNSKELLKMMKMSLRSHSKSSNHINDKKTDTNNKNSKEITEVEEEAGIKTMITLEVEVIKEGGSINKEMK